MLGGVKIDIIPDYKGTTHRIVRHLDNTNQELVGLSSTNLYMGMSWKWKYPSLVQFYVITFKQTVYADICWPFYTCVIGSKHVLLEDIMSKKVHGTLKSLGRDE